MPNASSLVVEEWQPSHPLRQLNQCIALALRQMVGADLAPPRRSRDRGARALYVSAVWRDIYFARKQRNDTYLLGSQKNPPKEPLAMVIVCPPVGTGQRSVLSTCFQIAPSVVVRISLPSA